MEHCPHWYSPTYLPNPPVGLVASEIDEDFQERFRLKRIPYAGREPHDISNQKREDIVLQQLNCLAV